MDFERMKDGCPWNSTQLTNDDRQIEICPACGGPCQEDNCAPYHWITELANSLWVSVNTTIRTDS